MDINGLTTDQVEMLDFMWNELETDEDFINWHNSLSTEDQIQADLLMRMVIMGSVDDDMESLTSFPEANKILAKFM